jgi:hypothetical protein
VLNEFILVELKIKMIGTLGDVSRRWGKEGELAKHPGALSI